MQSYNYNFSIVNLKLNHQKHPLVDDGYIIPPECYKMEFTGQVRDFLKQFIIRPKQLQGLI